tara:strand:+ start:1579 stop:2790 length:1212 start_codon:yes stop_codon:yes gene_type:complete
MNRGGNMSLYQLHEVQPENSKTSYNEYDVVDFVLPFENRALQLNSIRIVCDMNTDLTAFSAKAASATTGEVAVNLGNTNAVFYNNLAGGHSVIDSITTSFTQGGTIENFTNYPRYVAMKTAATKDKCDLLNASSACEGKTPLIKYTNTLLRGSFSSSVSGLVVGSGTVVGSQATEPFNVSFKPDFCLNNAAAQGQQPLLSHSKSGNIRVSIRLTRGASVLFGNDWSSSNNYFLENLKLTFVSRPDAVTPALTMETKTGFVQSITSDFSNIQAVVPAICKSVSASFIPQDKQNVYTEDNLQQHRLPGMTQLQFIWNDSTNTMVTYIIKRQAEVIERYLNSFNYMGKNIATLPNLQANRGFGVGVNFGEYVNLSNQKFQVQLQSKIGTEGNPHIAYLYFHGLLQM